MPRSGRTARADLSDVRLYDRDAQVPYALSEEQGASSTVEREARILNLGVRGGRTEFDLDIGGEAEYNQVQLRLKATNFVASATAEGRDALRGSAGRKLSTSTLYDFSREGLGNNFALRIPLATFRYLHVSITPAISPRDITGASTSAQREAQARGFPPAAATLPNKSAAQPESLAISIPAFRWDASCSRFRRESSTSVARSA